MTMNRTLLVGLAVATMVGCYGGGELAATSGDGGGAASSSSSSGSSGASSSGTSGGSSSGGSSGGPWCDVQAFVAANCVGCHTAGGASAPPMDTFAELSGPSPTYAGQTVAQRAEARLTANTMPPGGGHAASASLFATWIAAGYSHESCTGGTDAGSGVMAGPVDFGAPAACTSGSMWTRGEGMTMRPGEQCDGSCHNHGFSAAGTVFQTAHEPNDCNGASGVQVTLTDSSGTAHSTTSNSAGNFAFSRGIGTGPYQVALVYNGITRRMMTPLTGTLECNGCHTQNGTAVGGFPSPQGRIVMPIK
jgi:cytochrome c553